MICKNCNTENESGTIYSSCCGADLSKSRRKTAKKLTANTLDSRCCENCGSDLTPKKVTQQKGGRGCSVIILIVSISVSLLFAVL